MSLGNTRSIEGKERYTQARAACVSHNTTLNAWCTANGIHIQNVRDAFFGKWKGDGANALVARVLTAAGIK